MRTVFAILFTLLLLTPVHAFTTDQQEDICAKAAVIFCENFENRPLGHAYNVLTGSQFKNGGWAVSGSEPQGFTMDVVNDDRYDGSKSMKWTYPVNSGAGFMDGFYGTQTHIFWRAYLKNSSNWVWSGNGNKMLYIGGAVHPYDVMFDQAIFGGDSPSVNPQYGAGQFFISTGHFPLNQWVCMEGEVQASSAGSGFINIWQDGTPTLSATGITIDFSESILQYMRPSGYWNCTTGNLAAVPCDNSSQANQHPAMYRWVDNIVVSTERVGCLNGGSGVGDTTPPAAPTGLTLSGVIQYLTQALTTLVS